MRSRHGYRWDGELTGVCPLWGHGRVGGQYWYFRADLTGWAFQAGIPLRGESLLAGAKHTDAHASVRWGSTPCAADGTDLLAAW